MIANVIERQFKRANDWPFGAALSFLLMYATFIAIALRAYLSRNYKAPDMEIREYPWGASAHMTMISPRAKTAAQRNVKANGKGASSERVGKRVPNNISIYDVLWLVPSGPEPASYSWFANYNAKARFGYKYNLTKKTIHEIDKGSGLVVKRKVVRMKKRLRGFASEAARRMRGAKGPGVVVSAKIIANALTGPQSRSKHGVPVIRVAFRRNLTTAVPL